MLCPYFLFVSSSSHANEDSSLPPGCGFVPGGKYGIRKPLLEVTSQVQVSCGAHPRLRAQTQTLPGAHVEVAARP